MRLSKRRVIQPSIKSGAKDEYGVRFYVRRTVRVKKFRLASIIPTPFLGGQKSRDTYVYIRIWVKHLLLDYGD